MFDGIPRQRSALTRLLSRDINALEGRLRTLQSMRCEIANDPGGIIIMGPGRHGCDALASYGAPDALASLIQSYEWAITDLADQHMEADIAECVRRLFALHGAERAHMRQYLQGEIAAYREKVGTVRSSHDHELRRAA